IRFRLGHFENSSDILLDREAAENRGFLRQISDTEPGAAVHRQLGNVLTVELHGAGVGGDQAGNDVEAGRLAGAVRAEQPHNLAALDRNADIAQDRPALEAFAQAVTDQTAIIGNQMGSPTKPALNSSERCVGSAARASGLLARSRGAFPAGGIAFRSGAVSPVLPDEKT